MKFAYRSHSSSSRLEQLLIRVTGARPPTHKSAFPLDLVRGADVRLDPLNR